MFQKIFQNLLLELGEIDYLLFLRIFVFKIVTKFKNFSEEDYTNRLGRF